MSTGAGATSNGSRSSEERRKKEEEAAGKESDDPSLVDNAELAAPGDEQRQRRGDVYA